LARSRGARMSADPLDALVPMLPADAGHALAQATLLDEVPFEAAKLPVE
jgi:hypothetical protein